MGTLLINRDGERKPLSSSVRSKQNEKKYDYYGATGVIDKVDSYIFSEKLLLVGEDGANLLSKIKPNAFFAEGKYWVNNHAHILDATDKSLLDYVIVVINSISLDNYITGSAQPKLSQERLNKILLPLPPLSEQRRIVEKIEGLLALVDDLETNKTDLQSYIKQAKSKVLEMAIRGELVPQDSNNEPASVLLERIKNEQKPSKSKSKTTEHNTHYEEELPFDIPENWVWCRLREITMINPKNNIEDNKEVSFIPMTLISDGFSNKHSYEVRLWGEVKKGFTHFQEGDIGIAKITPCFENRKSVIFSNLVNEVGAGTTELHILRPFAYSEIKKYIYWFINTESFIQRGISHFSGAVGQQRVGKDILENTLIPLPPLSEQHRIVEKIEEIFSELEFIEEALI